MPVKKDPTGRRSVQVEVEVPGSPEEVWRAIATGPGISSWFVPTKVEEREGGAIAQSFGPNMDSLATITAWDPPHRYAADSPDDMGPNSPTVATEWIVEAKAGGQCVVRVVHSWFASSDDWDDQFGQHEQGWIVFFRLLRLYLTHFRGQHGAAVQLMPALPEPKEAAWATLVRALGLDALEVGARAGTRAGAPELSGVVERIGEPAYPAELVVRLERPAPGLAHLFALPMAGMVFLPIRLYLFGERAREIAAREEAAWGAWIAANLPSQA